MPIFNFIGMVLGMVAWTTRVGAELLLKGQREGQRTAIAERRVTLAFTVRLQVEV